MGPVSGLVPLRFHYGADLFVGPLIEYFGRQLSSFTSWEGNIGDHVMKALGSEREDLRMFNQAIFSWNTVGVDVSSTEISYHDQISGPVVLAQREYLSTAYAHDYGILIEVYEHEDHIAICPTWDRVLFPTQLIDGVLEDFTRLLRLIITTQDCTLQELLNMMRVNRP